MLYMTHQPLHPPADLKKTLAAADGYLFLGMPEEAYAELQSLPAERQEEAAVLRATIRVLLHQKRWKRAEKTAIKGTRLHPGDNEFMVQHAFALHQQSRGNEAINVLLNAPEWLRKTGILHYNLACYEAQLGDLMTARQCIRAAIEINASFKKNARRDPDLQRLWN